MASGPEEPRSPEWSPQESADPGGRTAHGDAHPPRTSPPPPPPTLHHLPPNPADDAPRRAPAASPWALPPFTAPIPEGPVPEGPIPEGPIPEGPVPEGEDPRAGDPPVRRDRPPGERDGVPAEPPAAQAPPQPPPPGTPPGTSPGAQPRSHAPHGRHPYPSPGTPIPIDELAERFSGRAPEGGLTAKPPDTGAEEPRRGVHDPGRPPAHARDPGPAEADPRQEQDIGGGTTWNPLPGEEEGDRRASGPGEGAREGAQDAAGGRTGRRGRRRRAAGPFPDAGPQARPEPSPGDPRYGPGYMRAVWPPEAVAREEAAAYAGSEAQAGPGREADPTAVTAPAPAAPTAPTDEPTFVPAEGHGQEADPTAPIRRIGAPPGVRPAGRSRPDSPRRGRRGLRGRGRHHREDPRPLRRRRRRLLLPVLVLAVIAGAGALGFSVVSMLQRPAPAGVRLAAGAGTAADDVFRAPPGAAGSGSSQVLNAVTSVGSTVVAVGSDTTSPVPRPLFLVSTDGGATWELGQVTGPAGVEARAGTAGRVTGGGGRWLAAGTEAPASVGARGAGLGLAGPSGVTARGMWTSADGRSWTAVDPARLTVFGPGDRIADLARTANGFVAVGSSRLDEGRTGPAAWVSPDGQEWTRVDLTGLGSGVRGVRAVVANGDQVVALADAGSGESGVAVLRSADGGRSWRSAEPPADGRIGSGALAVAGDGFVLVPTRQVTGGRVKVYCSRTGDSWRSCGEIGPLGSEGLGVRGLASSAAGLAAVAETGWQEYTVFTSEDGTTWAKGAELGKIPGTLRGVAITDQGTLVAGGDEPVGDVDNLPVLMTARKGGKARAVPSDEIAGLTRSAREIARIAAGANLFVAVGTAQGDAGIWTSPDGDRWTTIGADALGGPGRQALADVAHGPEGWLAVGGTMPDPAVARPLLVTSQDGARWRRVGESAVPEVPLGVYHLVPHAVAAGRDGYVIAGEQRSGADGTAVLWYTRDLRRFERAGKLPSSGAGVRLHDVAATSSGYVAVGGSGAVDRETGVVWTSADGRTWTGRARPMPEGARSAHLRRVLATSTGLVAVGTAVTGEGRRPFAAHSADDGRTWAFTWLPAEASATVLDLAVAGSAFVAVGSYGAPGDGAVWISADGRDWRYRELRGAGLSGDGSQWLGTVAALGDRVVAIGRSTTYTDDHLTLWRTTVTR